MPEPWHPDPGNRDLTQSYDPTESTPRSRGSRLQRALEHTAELAEEITNILDPGRNDDGGAWAGTRRERSPFPWSYSNGEHADVTRREDSSAPRPKRRKLDSNPLSTFRPSIRYGHFGQVEPGKLRLDLLTCDGGEHVDSRHPNVSLAPRNVLTHDKSVYCSTRSECNLVLVHGDDMPFCLEKLHIIGPEHGFTAPVREGTVYVAMTLQALQQYLQPPQHARRSATNPHPPPHRHSTRSRSDRSSERLSFLDALRDREILEALELRRGQPGTSRGESSLELPEIRDSVPWITQPPVVQSEGGSLDEYPDIDTPFAVACRPYSTLSDDDPGEEETSSPAVLDFRLQRLRLMRRRYEIESWEQDGRYATMPDSAGERPRAPGPYSTRLDAFMARTGYYDTYHPNLTRAGASDRHSPAPNEAKGGGATDVTSARFVIERGHKITIRFEPAVSGRFVMLQLKAHKTNVDVQSIIAQGYAGPRFFPSKEFR